jgi:hypothetical protein
LKNAGPSSIPVVRTMALFWLTVVVRSSKKRP